MIIGGGAIYAACLPMANKLYITHIEAEIQGDTQFPDWGNEFKETYSEAYQADEKNAYNMRFTILENNQIEPNKKSTANAVLLFLAGNRAVN